MTRGLAAEALGRVGGAGAKEPLLSLVEDGTEVERYLDGQMVRATVGVIARGALERLRG
jgi:hypothetical protein